MADPLKNPARWSAYSYTFATGKRPMKVDFNGDKWRWVEPDPSTFLGPEAYIHREIFARLQGGDRIFPWIFRTYFDAIAAANDAARRAIADGAWKPEAA